MADYKLPIITGTSLSVGDLLRWDGSDWVNYPDSNYGFVDRGDPATEDWHETGDKSIFNTDGTWRDLDCSSIVSAGAVAILFRCVINDNAVNSEFKLRKNGNANTWAIQGIRTSIINLNADGNLIVPCDSNRVIEYFGTNVAFVQIYLTIVGWFL